MVIALFLALLLVAAVVWLVATAAALPRQGAAADGRRRAEWTPPSPPAAPPLAARPVRSGIPPRHLPLEPAEPFAAPSHSDPPATSQVLFADPVGDYIEVDGVLVEPYGEAHPAGVPFHLRLRPPTTPGLCAVATSVLAGWADDGETVDVRIPAANPSRARLTDGNITIILDLEETSLR